VAIAAVVIVFLTAKFYYQRLSLPDGLDKKFFKQQWTKIEDLLRYGKEMNLKLAVIEADKLLEAALTELYFTGETTSQRLHLASYKYPALRSVFWAHKVRNEVVHDPRYILKYGETKRVLSLFKRALKILRVL
jgi:uncharacterized protein with HEPN domain